MGVPAFYAVEHRVLIQAVNRNSKRFPEDFMFQLTWDEVAVLKSSLMISRIQTESVSRSQFVILKKGNNIKPLPCAFTELGVAMLFGILRSDRAIQVNIVIMRAFIRLRRMLVSHADLAEKLAALEKKYDVQFKVVFDALRELMKSPDSGKRRQVGFVSKLE